MPLVDTVAFHFLKEAAIASCTTPSTYLIAFSL